MNLYDKASLIITPNAYKAGKIYAAKPTSGDGDLTFARNSVAYRNNALGVLEQVAINTPRLNYNTIGGCPALLIEPARTNLVLNSNTLNAATYTLDNITLSGNTIIENTSNSSHSLNTTFQSGYSINTLHTYSFLVKRGVGTRNVRISVSNGVDGDMFCTLNLSTGVASAPSGNGSWSNLSARAALQADGVTYLFEVTGQSSVGSNRRIACSIVNADAGFYLGDGVSSLEIQHLQGETGAFATSRILTTASSVTRVADNANLIRTFTSNSTIFLKVFLNNGTLADSTTYCILDIRTASNNRISLYRFNNTFNLDLVTPSGGGGATLITIPTLTKNTVYKFAIVTTATSCNVYINGVLVFTNVSYNMPILISSTINYGSYDGSAQWNGLLGENYIYDYTLTNSEAVALTT